MCPSSRSVFMARNSAPSSCPYPVFPDIFTQAYPRPPLPYSPCLQVRVHVRRLPNYCRIRIHFFRYPYSAHRQVPYPFLPHPHSLPACPVSTFTVCRDLFLDITVAAFLHILFLFLGKRLLRPAFLQVPYLPDQFSQAAKSIFCVLRRSLADTPKAAIFLFAQVPFSLFL